MTAPEGMPARSPDPAVPARKRRLVTRRRLLTAGGIMAGTGAVAAAGGAIAWATTRYPGGPGHEGLLALTGATALTGPQLRPVEDAVVLIRDGRITDVGPDVEVPEQAQVLELPGATILPGLIDMHVHLSFPELEPGETFDLGDFPGYLWDSVRSLPQMRRDLLAHGVTAVRSLGDELGWVRDLRRGVAAGDLEGPRIFCAGPVLTVPNGHPISSGYGIGADSDGVRLPGSSAQAETIVAELLDGDDRVDLIKVIHEGAPSVAGDPAHSPAVLSAIVGAAHAGGSTVTVHCRDDEDIAEALEAGVDGIEHLTLLRRDSPADQNFETAARQWPDGMLEQMAQAGVVLDPTLGVVAAQPARSSDDWATLLGRLHERLLEAHAAGVPLVAGSDAAVPGVPFGGGLLDELDALAAAGLPTREVLRATTTQAAAALRSEDIGVLEPGRAADLLVVDGDPLRDLGALRRVSAVLRDGRVVVGSEG